ncbi:MAG: glycosyltransferase, partial [Thermoguttaceae bacterium]|nr:glycosyltransferase [Thermoguttaceae bacterium]
MNVFRNASSRADSPDVTLIVTCYNKPELLKIVLQTAILQTTPPKEIIVADDGSKEENFTATREIRAQTSIPIIHAWQPDEG